MSAPKIPHWQQRQDPRWQKKRLEIMQRDEFKCCECGDATNQLQVHHRWYVAGRSVWQYPNCALQTLCDDCHKSETEIGIEYGQESNPLDWEDAADLFINANKKYKGWGSVDALRIVESTTGIGPVDMIGILMIASSAIFTPKQVVKLKEKVKQHLAKRNIQNSL